MDVDEAKIARLRSGGVPDLRARPGRSSIGRQRARGSRSRPPTTSCFDACRILFIAVDTPPSPSGDADLSRVQHAVVREIAARGGRAPAGHEEHGAGRHRRAAWSRSSRPLGVDGHHLRLQPRVPARGRRHPGLPASRTASSSAPSARGRRRRRGGAVPRHRHDVVRTSVPTAEMIKYASNAFLATKISFINEIANVCEQVGADVRTVAHGMGLDHRIGPHFLQAGHRLRRLVLPQGRAGAQAAGRQHRLPLPAPQRRDRGQRTCRSGAWWASSSGAWARCAARRVALLGPHLQAPHRRPARGGLHRARRPPHPRGRRGRTPTTP